MPVSRFTGTSALALDAKGRLSVPARHRDALVEVCSGRLALFRHEAGCLKLLPWPVWEALEGQLMDLPDEAIPYRRLYLGSKVDIDLDGSSRVLIPPELREAAQLTRDVSLVGVGSHFELWDKQRLDGDLEALRDAPKPDVVRALRY